jgi:hypothetical protein
MISLLATLGLACSTLRFDRKSGHCCIIYGPLSAYSERVPLVGFLGSLLLESFFFMKNPRFLDREHIPVSGAMGGRESRRGGRIQTQDSLHEQP